MFTTTRSGWAFTGRGTGRLLIAFTPAGRIEAFFREITKANAMPPQDPALWRAYGMELVGPPVDGVVTASCVTWTPKRPAVASSLGLEPVEAITAGCAAP